MTDETATADTPPKPHKGGWPKGKARPRKIAAGKPEKTEPRWKRFTRADDWSGEFASPGENRFDLPHLAEKYRDVAFQWVAKSVLGNEDICKHTISVMLRNGWQFVEIGDFPELDIPIVEIGGMVLMARPATIHRKAIKQEQRNAQGVLENMRQKHLLDGIPHVSGGNHPSARQYNRHNKSYERLDIPGGRDD